MASVSGRAEDVRVELVGRLISSMPRAVVISTVEGRKGRCSFTEGATTVATASNAAALRLSCLRSPRALGHDMRPRPVGYHSLGRAAAEAAWVVD